jgi:anti-sigma factor RsiW
MTNCAHWRERIAAYVDAELPSSEMDAFRAHAETCAACAAGALAFSQSKSAIRRAGNRYTAPAALRVRIAQSVAAQSSAADDEPRSTINRTEHDRTEQAGPVWARWPQWALAAAALMLVAAGLFVAANMRQRRQALAEFADLHVATLASSNPVEVVSTDRHTVKPWFQGRIPFTFDLPELQGTPFTLVGGRVAYFQGEPGAHLVFAYQRHFISAFIFRDTPQVSWNSLAGADQSSSFNIQSWTQRGLRYVVIGDANPNAIQQLTDLLKRAP